MDLRKRIQRKARPSHTISPDREIQHLRRVKREEWRPPNAVKALKQEHDRHIAVHQRLSRPGLIIGVHFRETSDDEQAYYKQHLRGNGCRFPAPDSCEVRAADGAEETPCVEHYVRF